MSKKQITTLVTVGIILLFSLITVVASSAIVDAGNVGVVKRMGAVQDTKLNEGFHLVAPFITEVVTMNVRTQIAEVNCSAVSNDLQAIQTSVAINYHVNKEAAAKLYKEVGLDYELIIIQPALQESIKAITAKFSAEELITRRQEISGQIKDELTAKISAYGLVIENFNITNLDFSEEFNKAIEAKQVEQQNALKAQQELLRMETEGKQTVVKAEAEAEALRIKRAELDENMLKLEWINKWDGKLPIVASDGSFFDINSILGN